MHFHYLLKQVHQTLTQTLVCLRLTAQHLLCHFELSHFRKAQVLLHEIAINHALLVDCRQLLNLAELRPLHESQVLIDKLVHRQLQPLEHIKAQWGKAEQSTQAAFCSAVHDLLLIVAKLGFKLLDCICKLLTRKGDVSAHKVVKFLI